MANGGFETSAGWTFPVTGHPAGYTTAAAHTGARAARFGVVPTGYGGPERDQIVPERSEIGAERNLLGELAAAGASYSSGYQTISIPADAARATLAFWWRPGTQVSGSPAAGGDFQRVLLLKPGTYTLLEVLIKTLANSSDWRQASFDLSTYRGQSVVLYFETYNDDVASAPLTWLFVDDVSVQACR